MRSNALLADTTGTYSYFCDGASPGSPVLSDGHATYTPGLSENRGGVSGYYANDRLGNLWTIDGSAGKTQLTYENNSAFGQLLSGASGGSPFGFGGGNGCQTDVDLGLVLMGHRYYDPRIGRFLSQDPAGDGDNWYAYCGNDPMNNTDPTGLAMMGSGFGFDPAMSGIPYDGNDTTQQYNDGDPGTYNRYDSSGNYMGTATIGSIWDAMNNTTSPGSPGAGMIAGGIILPKNPSGLPPGWVKDRNHQDPSGERWHNGNNGLEFGKGQPGKTGWKGKDHWHVLNKKSNGKWGKDITGGHDGGHYNPGESAELDLTHTERIGGIGPKYGGAGAVEGAAAEGGAAAEEGVTVEEVIEFLGGLLL